MRNYFSSDQSLPSRFFLTFLLSCAPFCSLKVGKENALPSFFFSLRTDKMPKRRHASSTTQPSYPASKTDNPTMSDENYKK